LPCAENITYMNWYTFLKTANELKRTSRKTLERLGIPFTEEVVRWKEYQGKYSPIKRLIVKDEDISPYLEWQEETKDKRKIWEKEYYENHKEHIQQVHKTWAEKNVDQPILHSCAQD